MSLTRGFSTKDILNALNSIPLTQRKTSGEIKSLATLLTIADKHIANVLYELQVNPVTTLDLSMKRSEKLVAGIAADKKTADISAALQNEFTQAVKEPTQRLYTNRNNILLQAENLRTEITKIAEDILNKINSGEIKPEQIQGQGSVVALHDQLKAAIAKGMEIRKTLGDVLQKQQEVTSRSKTFLEKCEQTATPQTKSQMAAQEQTPQPGA